MIATDSELAELLPQLEPIDRVAVDTEADSLHCYFEKLCLVQLSFGGHDYLVDPLAGFDLAPLAAALADKEIVLQGADFDLRLLRRSLNLHRDQDFRHGDRGASARHSRIQPGRAGREIFRDGIDQGFAESELGAASVARRRWRNTR